MEENLRLASRDGDIEKVKRLVKEGTDPNGCDQLGNTSFHWCCMSDNCPVEVLSFLVSSSSTSVSLSKIRNNDGSTPMHLAFRSGNLELIKYIYTTDTSSITEYDYNDKMPVHYTTQNTEILSFVISVLESSNIEVYKRIKIAAWCCMCVQESFLNVPGSFSTLQHLIEMMTFRNFLYKFEKEEDKVFVDFILRFRKLRFYDICTPLLHKVVKQGDVAIVTHFVDKIGCSINTMDEDGNTLLHVACYNNHFAIVKLLTNHHECYIETRDHNGRSALHIAAYRGHLRIVKYLVERKACDINVKDDDNETPLHLACYAGHLNVLEYLSDNELCDANAVTKNRVKPLHLVAQQGHLEVVKHLVERKGCNINVKNDDQATPFHVACYSGHLDVVEYLSNNVLCDVDAKDKNGWTALHSASEAGHLEVVKHLVERKGCDINVKNDINNTPLYMACRAGHLDVVEYLSNNVLCDVHTKGENGWTALHSAAEAGHLEVVKHLIQRKGCDINVKTDYHETPLHVACHTGHLDVVEYLSNNALCDVDTKGKHGWTALHSATEADGYTMLKVTKCILTGPPGAGKSTLKKRLLNESLGDDLSTGVLSAAVQMDSFHKLDQQGVIVPNINEDSNLEWRKQDVEEEAVCMMNTIAEPISNITVSENDETSSTDSENDEGSDYLRSVSVDTEEHRKISRNEEISTSVIHKRTEQYELRVKTPPAAVKWMEEDIEDHISPSNSNEHAQSEIDESIKPMEVRSHLHETLEQDSTTHDDDLKTKAIAEISKAVEKIPTKKKQQYISNIQSIAKDNHAVLQIIDTGGQPEFHEMLPALITGPAVNLLVFKLTEDLQGRYPITYRSSDGNSDPYHTSLTHEEVIFRSLSSIACLRYNTVGWNFDEMPVKDDSEPAAFLIATYRDCVDDDKVDSVNDHLKHRIQTSAELCNLVQFSAPGKPIFAIDTTRDQNEIEDLRKSLHNVINTKFQDIKIPVSWCALSLKLKRRKQSLYTYQTCFNLAKESGIKDEDDFKAVLWFLHNRAGTIMYYPDVEGLEDVIITNIQLVFDRITQLMTSCFTFKNLGISAEEQFDTMGMFTESDIRELSKRKGDPLTPKRLVALLKYLHIVAGPLKTKVGRSTKISYFMPCALKPANIESEHRNETSTPAPLLIWFECGYCPVGVYCCLVVYLLSLSEQTELKWELANPPHYRNKISFVVGKQYDHVTILSRATYIEVWVDQAQEFEDPVRLKTLCQNLRSILNQGIDAVTKTLLYSYNSRHYFGFPCCCSSSSSCLPPHPAVCEYEEPVAAKCVLIKDTMKLKDNHSIWFQQVCFKL